jgi:WD40 repeat protein
MPHSPDLLGSVNLVLQLVNLLFILDIPDMKFKLICILILAILVFPGLAACSLSFPAATPTPTYEPTATQTPSPTYTSTPTPTATPTITLTPTPSLTPTPLLLVDEGTPLPEVLSTLSLSSSLQVSGLAEWKIGSVTDLAWSPDSQQLSAASFDEVFIFDPQARTELKRLEPSGGALSLAYSPSGSLLAAGNQIGSEDEGYSGSVDFWYVPNWETWRTINDYTRAVTSLDFSQDGLLFMAAFTNPDENENSVAIWDTRTWEITQTLKTGSVSEIALAPNGKQVATTPDRYAIKIWQTKTGLLQRTIHTSFTGAVSQIAFSPDGKTFAAGSYDGSIRVWDVDTATLQLEMNTGGVVASLAYNPDGNLLASGGGYQSTVIQLWDITNGALLRTLDGHPSAVVSLAFSPDGQLLASGSYDGTLRLWGLRP